MNKQHGRATETCCFNPSDEREAETAEEQPVTRITAATPAKQGRGEADGEGQEGFGVFRTALKHNLRPMHTVKRGQGGRTVHVDLSRKQQSRADKGEDEEMIS